MAMGGYRVKNSGKPWRRRKCIMRKSAWVFISDMPTRKIFAYIVCQNGMTFGENDAGEMWPVSCTNQYAL
jgi:hypothetical protein